MSLYIHEAGAPDAPTVVFLHGLGLSGAMWQPQMERLMDFHCLAPDLPEHGKSTDLLLADLQSFVIHANDFGVMQRHGGAIPSPVPLDQIDPVAVPECVDRPEVAQIMRGEVLDAHLLA